MSDKKKRTKIMLLACSMLLSLSMILPVIRANANEDEPVLNRLGKTTGNVNVREGAGEGLYDIIVHNGEKVNLKTGTDVVIIGEEVYKANGKLWYNIIFKRNGEELSGWVTSTYITVVGTITATPIPSPTPEPATPTPSPEPTPSPTPTPLPATPTPMPTIDPSSGDFRFVWGTIAALVILAVIAIAVIFVKNKVVYTNMKGSEISQRMRRLKNINLAEDKEETLSTTMITRRRRPEVRIVDENNEDREYDPELYDSLFTEEYQAAERIKPETSKEMDEKKALRAEINKLKQHDIVIHRYFGKGEVYDNSDVKLLEVRFGSDVRFLNKESLVSKRLLVKYEEDKLPGRKR